MTMMSFSIATSAMAWRSSSVSTPPVGLCGELKMIIRVRGVTRLAEFVGVEAEVVVLGQAQRDRRAAGVAGHRLVDREARIGVDDLVALVDQRQKRIEHDGLRTRRHDYVGGVDVEAAPDRGVTCDGLAQNRQAERRRVVRKAVVEGLLGRVADVDRSVEIGLADL